MRIAALSTVLVLAFAAELRAAAPYRIGGTVPHALAQVAPTGAAPADLRLEHVMFFLGLRNRTEVEGRIAAQQDRRSPFFHKWLGPDEIADRYGPRKSEYERLRRWLKLHGFTVVRDSPFRVSLVVAGTAADVERALKAPIALYRRNGKVERAPTVDPALPSDLAPSVQGILGLDNLDHFRPLLRRSVCKRGPNDRKPCSSDTDCPNGSCGRNALAPAEFSTVYGVTPLRTAGLSGLDKSIAVIARSNFLDSDIAAFSQRFLSGVPLTPRRAFAGPDPGVDVVQDERIEVLLDTQWAGALAPAARVNVVISTQEGNIPEALVKAVDERLGDVITMSFGICEAAYMTSATATFDAFYAIANLQGQSVLVASGDAGAFDCSPDSPIVSVNALASSPHAVAVGGSSFILNSDGTLPGTINETVWDEPPIGAGGGGRSAVFGLPPYQRAVGLASLSTGRAMPDLSIAAGVEAPGYWMVADGLDMQVGGTSASAPALASVLALVNERLGTQGLGQFLPSLYRLGVEQTRGGPAVFRDITQGSNGFPAGVGFDLASGWGAPIFDALAANLEAGRACDSTIECLVPGRGSARSACAGQWLVEHRALAVNRNGVPHPVQSCRDGDLACDGDGVVNNSCTFNVALCLNVFDFRRLVRRGQLVVPRCDPGIVRRVRLLAPKVSQDTQQNQNRDAVATAIASLPDLPTSLVSACGASVPVIVPLPTTGSRRNGLTIRTRVTGSRSTTAKVTLRCTAQ